MMEKFKSYLLERRYRQSTMNEHLKNIGYFFKWIEANGLDEVENIQYTDLLNYVQYEQNQNKDVSTIHLRISSIGKYFEFLKQEEIVDRNPARTLRIKGKTKTIIHNPLTYDELLQLYNNYKPIKKVVAKNIQRRYELAYQRNIVITGLLIWQGLHFGELAKLEVGHVNLNEGIIYIPSTSRSNSRELKLSNQQILPLHTYINGGVRENFHPKGNELFIGNQHGILRLLMDELKGVNPQIKNAGHIRSSVIMYWLKQHNKRQVQYMAGHRYITSTEKYVSQQLDTLTDQLSHHHPFG